MTKAAQAVFQHYVNLLTEEAHKPWESLSRTRQNCYCTSTSLELNGKSHQAKCPSHSRSASYSTSSCVLHMMQDNFEILYLKLPEEAQQGAHSSVCAARTATEQLQWGPPMSILQSQCKFAYAKGQVLHGCRTCMTSCACDRWSGKTSTTCLKSATMKESSPSCWSWST